MTEDLVQAAAGGAAAVLRVLGERNRTLDTVLLHPTCNLWRQRVDVSETGVVLMRGTLRTKFVEKGTHGSTLGFCVFEDGRAAADSCILDFDGGCAPFCDEWGEKALERERDEVGVGEEVGEEGLDVGELEGV